MSIRSSSTVVGRKLLLENLRRHKAGVIVHGDVHIVRAELWPVLEGGSHACLAGGGVGGVPAAERKGEDGVWSSAYGTGGEEGGVGGGLLGEGGREEH